MCWMVSGPAWLPAGRKAPFNQSVQSKMRQWSGNEPCQERHGGVSQGRTEWELGLPARLQPGADKKKGRKLSKERIMVEKCGVRKHTMHVLVTKIIAQ